MIRPKFLYGARCFVVHGQTRFDAGLVELAILKGNLPRPKAHYSLTLKNHETGERLKLDLVDLPFVNAKSFRVRINNRWATKVPVASKTAVHPVR